MPSGCWFYVIDIGVAHQSLYAARMGWKHSVGCTMNFLKSLKTSSLACPIWLQESDDYLSIYDYNPLRSRQSYSCS